MDHQLVRLMTFCLGRSILSNIKFKNKNPNHFDQVTCYFWLKICGNIFFLVFFCASQGKCKKRNGRKQEWFTKTLFLTVSASIVHLSDMIKQNCFWRTRAAQGRQQLGRRCREGSQSHFAMYGSSRGYYGYSISLAGWAILVRLAGSSSWPTLNSQLTELSGVPGWLPGTFQFTTLHTWSHGEGRAR